MEVQLEKLRKLAGINQTEMAEKLDVKVATYRSWEKGKRMLSLKQAYDCAVILGCSIDAIAGYTPHVSYADPAQEALNGYWESMNDDGRERLLGIAEVILGCSIDAIAGYTPHVSYADPAQEALNGYWESMNDDGRERLLGIAELAADSGKVRVQKNAGDIRVPAYEYRPRWEGARR